MLGQINTKNRNSQRLTNQQVQYRKRKWIAFFAFQYIIDKLILWSMKILAVSNKLVDVKKYMVDRIYLRKD